MMKSLFAPPSHPLHDVPGALLLDAYQASRNIRGHVAYFTLNTLDSIRVQLSIPAHSSTLESLSAITALPGNWRRAQLPNSHILLTDIPKLLHHSLKTIVFDVELVLDTLGLTSGALPATSDSSASSVPITKDELVEALQAPWWNDQTATAIGDGWELRPTVGSQPLPVTLLIEGDRVRCRRDVVAIPTQPAIVEAIHLLALRLNGHIKHARLACVDGKLVAEACLHRDQLGGPLLAELARAVAVAAHRVRTSFGILREHEEIANLFATMFSPTDFLAGECAAPDLPHSPRKGGI